jgi:hypothetical protein
MAVAKLKARVKGPPGTWQLAVRMFKKSRTAFVAGVISLGAVVQDHFSLIKDYVPEDKQVWVYVGGIGTIAFARFTSMWERAMNEIIAEDAATSDQETS